MFAVALVAGIFALEIPLARHAKSAVTENLGNWEEYILGEAVMVRIVFQVPIALLASMAYTVFVLRRRVDAAFGPTRPFLRETTSRPNKRAALECRAASGDDA